MQQQRANRIGVFVEQVVGSFCDIPFTEFNTRSRIQIGIATMVPICGEYPGFGPMMLMPSSLAHARLGKSVSPRNSGRKRCGGLQKTSAAGRDVTERHGLCPFLFSHAKEKLLTAKAAKELFASFAQPLRPFRLKAFKVMLQPQCSPGKPGSTCRGGMSSFSRSDQPARHGWNQPKG